MIRFPLTVLKTQTVGKQPNALMLAIAERKQNEQTRKSRVFINQAEPFHDCSRTGASECEPRRSSLT